jgi:hypothetical protein
VQRLSRQWNAAVDSSPTIKAKLGIRSQGVTASKPARFTNVQMFPTAGVWAEMAFPMYSCDLALNPNFYSKTLHGVHMRWEEGCPDARVHDAFDVLWSSPTLRFGSYVEEDYGQPSFGPSRTWRDMYLTQPPITTGIIQLHPSLEFQDRDASTVYVTVRDHSGITLGLLHDTIVASLGPQFRKNMASGHGECFWGEFRFVTNCENLTEQCLRTIFERWGGTFHDLHSDSVIGGL